MAVVSSHVLNGVDGTHAGSVGIVLHEIGQDGSRRCVFASETDPGGRLVETIDASEINPSADYELVLGSGRYWAEIHPEADNNQIIGEVVLRFRMPDNNARYHMPVILSPNSYSTWLSR